MLANGVIEEVSPPEAFCASQNPVVQQFIQGKTEGPIQVL
jgi:ABC-type transporter Mla maintaining outer membrane lipid asymmetry ATPase subunit MlaF